MGSRTRLSIRNTELMKVTECGQSDKVTHIMKELMKLPIHVGTDMVSGL